MKPLDRDDIDLGVLGRLRDVVAARPAAVALKDATGTTSFAELAAAAADVRNFVKATDSEESPEIHSEPVAVLMGHDRFTVSTIFGVIATGRPVLVLDPSTPPARLR